MSDTYKLSEEGHNKLQAEYEELKNAKRKAAVERLAKARAMGDLSENSEYSAAKEDLSFIDGRVAEIEEILKNVEIIHEQKDKNHVQLGDTVIVEVNGSKEEYVIVGELEADITAKKISDSSPIGKAILGVEVGTKVNVEAPAGTVEYKVIEIK